MNNTQLDLTKIDWHDATILGITIQNLDNKLSKIIINSKVYLNNNDKNRIKINIMFEKIKNGAIIFNSSELIKNADAGNVNSCYIYKNRYQFNLFGGFIEIKTKIPPKIFID